jgi:peroxiredoxin
MNEKKGWLLALVLMLSMGLAYAQDGIMIGEKAPLFKAEDQHGNMVDLSEQLKKGPVVITFYRGQWCPFCNRYMSALQDSLLMIADKGASVIAITPEKGEEIQKTIEKSNAAFSVIYDKNHRIMDAYDVTFTMGGAKFLMYKSYGIDINKASGNDDKALPIPATYIISKKGKVINRHFDNDYKKRMTVKEILDSL